MNIDDIDKNKFRGTPKILYQNSHIRVNPSKIVLLFHQVFNISKLNVHYISLL